MQLTTRQQTIDGIELISCLPEQGNGKPPLLFVHGAFAAAWTWNEQYLPYFAQLGYAAHALSLRGHGESFGCDHVNRHSIRDYVDDVESIVRHLGQMPVLLGHSMGGFVVQKFLEHHAAPATVLMSSVPPQGLLAASFHMLFSKPGLLLEMNQLLGGGDISLQAARDALFFEPVPDSVLAGYMSRMSLESQRAMWDMSMFNLVNQYAVKRTPLLVLGTQEDQLVPAFLVSSTAHSYGVEPMIFKGLGHGFPMEKGGMRVAEAVAHWLAEHL